MNALAMFAAENDKIDISVGGLIIGALLGILIYVIGDWAAKSTGHSIIRVVGAVLGIIVFFVLGFDVYD